MDADTKCSRISCWVKIYWKKVVGQYSKLEKWLIATGKGGGSSTIQ